jgi:hypothetical protein
MNLIFKTVRVMQTFIFTAVLQIFFLQNKSFSPT